MNIEQAFSRVGWFNFDGQVTQRILLQLTTLKPTLITWSMPQLFQSNDLMFQKVENNIEGDLRMYSRCHLEMRLLSSAPGREVPDTMIYFRSHFHSGEKFRSQWFMKLFQFHPWLLQNLYFSPNDCNFCWCRKLEWFPTWPVWSVAEFKRLPKPSAFFTKCWFQQPTSTWIALAPPFSKVSAGKVLAVGVVASLHLCFQNINLVFRF